MLDTGDEGCLGFDGYDCLRGDQVSWAVEAAKEIPIDDESKGRGFMFMHIPL